MAHDKWCVIEYGFEYALQCSESSHVVDTVQSIPILYTPTNSMPPASFYTVTAT